MTLDPLKLCPDKIQGPIKRIGCLQDKKLRDIQLRFLTLRIFNQRLKSLLPLLDLSLESNQSPLIHSIRQLRGLLMSTVKLELWKDLLTRTATPNDKRPAPIVVDRSLAMACSNRGKTDYNGKKAIFSQMWQKLQSSALVKAFPLCHNIQPFRVAFSGEYGDDAGGLFRDAITAICLELQSTLLPLFCQCPNNINDLGKYRDCWIPAPSAESPMHVSMFEFLGRLLGSAIRTEAYVELAFPPIVWKKLVQQPITMSDIEDIDKLGYFAIETLRKIKSEEEWNDYMELTDMLKFTARGSDGKEVDLLPGGSSIPVSWTSRALYLRMAEEHRLTEFDRQCEALRRGVGAVVPRYLLSLFQWHELERMVCGRPDVDIDLLRDNTIYGEHVSSTDPHVLSFWATLQDMTNEQRQQYLRFVWGRSRPPLNREGFRRKHKINQMEGGDKRLPVSHTCFFSIDLPAYTSKELLQTRLLYAIENCVAIDADNTTVAFEAGNTGFGAGDDSDAED